MEGRAVSSGQWRPLGMCAPRGRFHVDGAGGETPMCPRRWDDKSDDKWRMGGEHRGGRERDGETPWDVLSFFWSLFPFVVLFFLLLLFFFFPPSFSCLFPLPSQISVTHPPFLRHSHTPTYTPTMLAGHTMRRAATAVTSRLGQTGAIRWASSNAEGESAAAEAVASTSGTGEPQHLNHHHNNNNNAKKYVQLQERKVSNTWNIPKKDLFLDMLFNGQGPLLEPVKVEVAEKLFNSPLSRMYVTKNGEMKVNRHPGGSRALRSNSTSIHNSIAGHHNRHHSHTTTITEDLARYRAIRDARRDRNHNVFFSSAHSGATGIPGSDSTSSAASTQTPPSSTGTIFTHSAASQLSLENNALLNLPHSLLLSLQPFSCRTQPGDESYRDDRIVVRKLQIEEKDRAGEK